MSGAEGRNEHGKLGESAGFTLPLSEAEFDHAVRRGLGRAVLHGLTPGASSTTTLLAECARGKINVYDDSPRVAWLFSIAESLGALDELRQQVTAALTPPLLDRETYEQSSALQRQIRFAFEFARRGDAKFLDLLRQDFPKDHDGCPFDADEELIHIEGEEGLEFVVRRHGRIREQDPSHSVPPYQVSRFEDAIEADLHEILEDLRPIDREVQAFFEALDQGARNAEVEDAENEEKRQRHRSWSVEDVVAYLRRMDGPDDEYPVWSWGAASTEEQRRELQDFIFEFERGDQLFAILRAFSWWNRRLPQFDERLLPLIEHEELRVRQSAACEIERFTDPRIRAYALECLEDHRYRYGVQLLARNSSPGDADRIAELFHLPDDEFGRECLLDDLLSFSRESRQAIPSFPLFVYEQTESLLRRCDALELLLETGTAPHWLVEECHYDLDEKTREWVDPSTQPEE